MASHDNPLCSNGPLDDFCRFWNSCADQQAGLKDSSWPSFLTSIRDRYTLYRDYWGGLVSDLVDFHLKVAELDCVKLDPQDEFELDVEDDPISPNEFVWTSNTADFSSSVSFLQHEVNIFGSNHDGTFRAVFWKLLAWLLQEDRAAANMRSVSLLEIYVGFRLSIEGRGPLVCFVNRFLILSLLLVILIISRRFFA